MEKNPALACLVILLKRIVSTFESFRCNNAPARLFRIKALEVMVSTVWQHVREKGGWREREGVCVCTCVYICVLMCLCVCACMCVITYLVYKNFFECF